MREYCDGSWYKHHLLVGNLCGLLRWSLRYHHDGGPERSVGFHPLGLAIRRSLLRTRGDRDRGDGICDDEVDRRRNRT